MQPHEQDLFFDALPDPAYQVDSRGTIVGRNRAAGARHGDWLAIGSSLLDRLSARSMLPWPPTAAVEGEAPIRLDALGPNGEALIAQLFGGDGRYFATLRTPAREPVESRVHESEPRFRAMADYAPVMIWMSGEDMRCDWFNQAWLQFTGRSAAEETGNGWTEGVHAEDLPRCMEIYSSSFARREPFTLEYRLRRNDGQYRWILDTGVARYTPERRFAGYIGACIDVQRQKELEGDLREHAQALETMEGRKDEFLGMLAHELRNPLAPIHGASQLLQSRALDETQRAAALAIIQRQVRNLTRLIGDLLDVNRFTRGKIVLQREWIDVGQAIRDGVEMSRPSLDAHGQHLSLDLPGAPVTLHADPMRVAQVISNLLDNASRYSPRGAKIELRARHTDNEVCISVRDPGIGIAPDLIASVWEPFVQLDRRVHQTHGGLGVGLALVRTLVQMHGGQVEAHSEGADRGAEFIVRLPLSVPAP